MHLVARDLHRLDALDSAVDLEQASGDIICLSFSDSDLGALAAAHAARPGAPSLRLANLARLQHPYSVDLYLENTVRNARVVVVRCLGGADYWRYGIDQLAAMARQRGIALAIVPGDQRADDRLDRASTLGADDLRLIWRFFDEGGPANLCNLIAYLKTLAGRAADWSEPECVPPAGPVVSATRTAPTHAPRALIVVYRSLWLAADIAPAESLADAAAERGFAVETIFVTSLKDARVAPALRDALAFRPDIILNTTAFSARDGGGGLLDAADCPVIQASFSTITREAWDASPRGLGAVDLAVNVVLPEIDGRLIAPPISFKAQAVVDNARDFRRAVHQPYPDGVATAADLAAGWARLRRLPREKRRVALVLSDYPLKGGREGYAVGLDTPASVDAIVDALRAAGYVVGPLPRARELVATLAAAEIALTLAEYRRLCAALPPSLLRAAEDVWGSPEDDPAYYDGALRLRALIADNLVVAFQPDRGTRADRRESYHDAALPPRHAYLAFYLWLRATWRADALVHLGTHGTLEWLPGKSVALSRDCAPLALTRGLPVVYPYVVSDPGEAAVARRRLSAVAVGHLTPPLVSAGGGSAAAEIEALLDEYAAASGLDPRRAALIADAILARALETGLAGESGIDASASRAEALTKLDAWLCDIKDLRLGDGLHVFGREAPGEIKGLLAALDGRFVPPGPAGAPSRCRTDVLPTGRNLYGIDPRAVPTRTAATLGARTADAVLTRFTQDHGDWPRSLMIDLWGSSTMRTGGEDFAQALALVGVRPVWDTASTRVTGFEVLTSADLGRPRVDITLRISGLFRDVFPGLIELFDAAVRAVAQLDEDSAINPLAAARRACGDIGPRVFGPAPGSYGSGLSDMLALDGTASSGALGEAYLAAQAHGFTRCGAVPSRERFMERIETCDALVHVQDMAETDVLAGAAFAEEEGGFAAALATLGRGAAVYHVDATRDGVTKVRTLAEEVARVVRGKFGGEAWIAGLMRHGHRGAAEIAETIGNLVLFAVTSGCVTDASFDLAFDATLGNETVRAFLDRENQAALVSIARHFALVRDRGLWTCRRNSTATLIESAAARAAA